LSLRLGREGESEKGREDMLSLLSRDSRLQTPDDLGEHSRGQIRQILVQIANRPYVLVTRLELVQSELRSCLDYSTVRKAFVYYYIRQKCESLLDAEAHSVAHSQSHCLQAEV
jgi:hypothetical protein